MLQEKSLTKNLVSVLWHAMNLTGKGYRRHSLRHTGRGDDRRRDKLDCEASGVPQWLRRYRQRYSG